MIFVALVVKGAINLLFLVGVVSFSKSPHPHRWCVNDLCKTVKRYEVFTAQISFATLAGIDLHDCFMHEKNIFRVRYLNGIEQVLSNVWK